MTYDASPAFAAAQDAADPLATFRQEFHIPPGPDGQPTTYFCGNSLGLLPRAARAAVEAEFKSWETQAVEGHFHGESPWMFYQDTLAESTARVVGAQPIEVVVMNTLTVNLHLLLVSFYQPTATRYKVLMEGGAFPSDQYALESQARLHGLDPAEAIVEITPRPGESTRCAPRTLRPKSRSWATRWRPSFLVASITTRGRYLTWRPSPAPGMRWGLQWASTWPTRPAT
jgi:kynureninase